MINGLTNGSESYLSPSSHGSLIKLLRELHMENHGIELQEHVPDHDRPIVVGIRTRARFVDRVNNVMRPRFWKTRTGDMVEQVS